MIDQESPALATHPSDRIASRLGLLLALATIGVFVYPVGAFPLQSFTLDAVLLAAAVGLAVAMLRSAGGTVGGSPVAWFISAGLALGLWAAGRWLAMDVTAPGREGVIGSLWFGVALVAGVGLSSLDCASPGGRPRAWPAFRRAWALAAIAFGMWALLQYFVTYPRALANLESTLAGPVSDLQTQSLLHALRERRVAGRLGNPNLFAAQLAVLALFSLSLLGRGERRPWRAVGAAGFTLCLIALALTGSRGGTLTFALAGSIGGATLWLQRREGSPRRTLAAFALMALGAAAILGHAASAYAATESWMERLGNVATIRERIYYWSIALQAWARHPFIGSGPGSFELLYLQFKPDLARESRYAHSWIFQSGAELGIVGLALWGLLWAGVARALWLARRVPARPPHASEAWWLGWAALLPAFDGLFEFSLQWREFLILAGLLAGGAIGLTAPPPGSPRRGIAAVTLIAALAVGVLAPAISVPWHAAQWHRLRADDAAWSGDWAAADDRYRRAAQWLPDDGSLLMARAVARERLGDPQAAWELLDRAGRLNPYSARVAAEQADWFGRQGRIDEAIERIGVAIDRYPSKVDYWLRRAAWRLEAGRVPEARADLETIERRRLPLWEFQQPAYAALRAKAGLANDER